MKGKIPFSEKILPHSEGNEEDILQSNGKNYKKHRVNQIENER
jgi:hypothetical protein